MTVKNKHKTLYFLPNNFMLFVLLCGAIVLSSCNKQARGFALPEGDIQEGIAVYNEFSCYECHSSSEIPWKGGNDSLKVPLGGEQYAEKSYGDLVTSVINPSHKIARAYKQKTATDDGLSKMVNYNEVMTVQELIDLVAFLQSEYKIKAPPTNYYPYY